MKANDFDSLAIPVDEIEQFDLRHPATGEPILDEKGKPAWVAVRSAESTVGQEVRRAILDRRLKSGMKRGGMSKISATQLERESIELLAALISSWYLVGFDGKAIDIECNEANKRKLLNRNDLKWIRDQVDEFTGDLGSFLPNDSENSSNLPKTSLD